MYINVYNSNILNKKFVFRYLNKSKCENIFSFIVKLYF